MGTLLLLVGVGGVGKRIPTLTLKFARSSQHHCSGPVLLFRVHLVQNPDFGKRRQEGPAGSKWLTRVCAKLFDQKIILVIGALDVYVDRRLSQILKTI